MTEEQQAVQSHPFKDRSTGLTVFGIIQLCVGGLAAATALLMASAMLSTGPLGDKMHQGGGEARMLLMNVTCGVGAAAWFTTMGVGSILSRRWARALTLVSSWIWLLLGLVWISILLLFLGAAFQEAFNESPSFLPVARIMKVVVIGVSVFLFVVVPGALVLFYRGNSVKATCEARNRSASWTDACPLPVLALELFLSGRAVLFLMSLVWPGIVSFWGLNLHGIVGVAVALLIGGVCFGLAWGLHKLKRPAWWASIVFVTLWALTDVFAYIREYPMNGIEKPGLSEQHLQMVRMFRETYNTEVLMLYSLLFCWFAVIGLLLYIRRYFWKNGENEK